MTTFAAASLRFQTLALAYSIFHYAMAVDLAGRNAEAVAAFARALRRSGAGDEPARTPEISSENSDGSSVQELLALDQRSIACKAPGETMGNLTMPLRRDLILASSIVC